MILIKSTQDASFKSAIDVLDQLAIAGIPNGHYAKMDVSDNEIVCIKKFK